MMDLGFSHVLCFLRKPQAKSTRMPVSAEGPILKKKKKQTNTLTGTSNDSQSLKTILPSLGQNLWLQGPSGPITSFSNYGFCGFCLQKSLTPSPCAPPPNIFSVTAEV